VKSGSGRSQASGTKSAAAAAHDQRTADRAADRDATLTATLPIIVAGTARINELSLAKKVVWNEILAYVFHYRNNSTGSALNDVVLKHFSSEDISDAKRILVQEFQYVASAAQFFTERRNSTARSAREAELDDIVGIFQAADADPQTVVDEYLFLASDFKQLPKYGPEELNIAVVVDRQVQMEQSISYLSSAIQKMSASAGSALGDVATRDAIDAVSKNMQQQLKDYDTATSARLDQLSAVCTQLVQNVESVAARCKPPVSSPSAPNRPTRPTAGGGDDRANNIVMFGVPEDPSLIVWRKTVEDALHHVNDNDVIISDLYRVGRYAAGKVRPVIVKLQSSWPSWDRRLILINCKKLKNYPIKIFITADESLETRRSRTLQRMKSRAELDGKVVDVVDGVLVIDGNGVFSLRDGKINQHGR